MALFSIITTCRNAKDGIEKTIRSVLSQDFRDFEYIIMDGLSTDETFEIASSFREDFENAGIPYLLFREADHGIYEGMNHAALHASGDYVNFMNADDVLYDPETLSKIAQKITASGGPDKRPDVFYGDAVAIEFGQSYHYAKDLSLIEKKMPFSHQSVFAKRQLVLDHPFREHFTIASDYDFLLTAYKESAVFSDLGLTVCTVTLDGLSSVDLLNAFIETTQVQKDHGISHYTDAAYEKKLRMYKIKQFVMDHFPKGIIFLIRKVQRIHRGQNEHC